MRKYIFLIVVFAQILSGATIRANVTKVVVNGSENKYKFSVTLKSDETGCEQFANWWEILSKDGTLLYRRILVHSHPDTQPFTRSGSRVKIKKTDTVYIRAHMNNVGYSGDIYVGSVQNGFSKLKKKVVFDLNIVHLAPLPSGCLY
ncbi:hypothetical protein JHD48_05285 [Sulfurimonas sp. SAG-AH-194-I05]|nr:hypothetical protein [Sulfurimonas sp. SAG-AH-194-I05]MDF1875140.1 hypothetical protein [Sulfurimonas sp. SAG-AH-194-I05]